MIPTSVGRRFLIGLIFASTLVGWVDARGVDSSGVQSVIVAHKRGPLNDVAEPVLLRNGHKVIASTLSKNWSTGALVLLSYAPSMELQAHFTKQFENSRSGLAFPQLQKTVGGFLAAAVFKEQVFAEASLWVGHFDESLRLLSEHKIRVKPEGVRFFEPRWLKVAKVEAGYRFFIQSSQQGPYEGLAVVDVDHGFGVRQRAWFTQPGARFYPLPSESGGFSVVAFPGHFEGGHRILSFRRYWFDENLTLRQQAENNPLLGEVVSVRELPSGNLELWGSEIYSSPVDGHLRSRMSRFELTARGRLLSRASEDAFDKPWRDVKLKQYFELQNGDRLWIGSGSRNARSGSQLLLLLLDRSGAVLNRCVWGEAEGIEFSSARLSEQESLHLLGNRAENEIWIAEVDPYVCSPDRPRRVVVE